MRLPFISIIIPTRNEEKNLPRVLKSIKQLDYLKEKLEIIIVDGHSEDKTVQIAKKFGARVFLNPGRIRSTGCQIGIEKSKGELIAFTDADCVVPSDWLKGLLKPLKGKKTAAVGGPNITPKDDTPFAKAFGEALWLLTRPGSRYGYSGRKVVEIYHNPGCNVLYQKKAIQTVRGFNPKLLTCEDEELDFRLTQKGYKLLFTPHVSVDHYRRPNYKKIFIQAYRFAIGRVQAIKLHLPMARWFHFAPSALLLSLLISPFLILLFPALSTYTSLYLLLVLTAFLAASWYLALIRKTVPFYIYLFILLNWFLGWGLGFLKGLFSLNS